MSDSPNQPTLRLCASEVAVDSKRPLFTVPAGLVRILDRDLLAAGIGKRDERERRSGRYSLKRGRRSANGSSGAASFQNRPDDSVSPPAIGVAISATRSGSCLIRRTGSRKYLNVNNLYQMRR